MSSRFDYSTIKELAKLNHMRVTDLIALAPANDPFYVGTPNDKETSLWFARLWKQFGYGRGVHLRRIHYQIISQSKPVAMPNGKAIREYRNLLGLFRAGFKNGSLP